MSKFILSQASASGDESDTPSEYELLAPVAEVQKAAKFRFSARQLLLTYAQCPEDPLDILDKLDARNTIKRAVGAIELHADGQPHVHLAIEYVKKLNVTNSRHWDYQPQSTSDTPCAIYHPNAGPAGSWPKCINYCRGKEKTLVQLVQYRCTFQEALDQHVADGIARAKPNLFESVVGKTRQQWIQFCFEHNAGQFMEATWKAYHARPNVHTIDSADIPDRIRPGVRPDPRFAFMQLPESWDKSYVICGPSGSGKTTWAANRMVERFGTILVINAIDQLKELDINLHKAILFDEIRFTGHPDTGKGQWPLEAQIAVCDTERGRSVHCRYSNAAIPAGFPRVFTCTHTLPFSHDFQIERRITLKNMYDDRDDSQLWLSFK